MKTIEFDAFKTLKIGSLDYYNLHLISLKLFNV